MILNEKELIQKINECIEEYSISNKELMNILQDDYIMINKKLFNLDLSLLEIFVLNLIQLDCKQKEYCDRTDEEIAQLTHVSKITISRAMSNLDNQGYIIRESSGSKRIIKEK